jgi:hypothetical protein
VATAKPEAPRRGSVLTRRQRILKRLSGLRLERSTWISHYRELSQYQQPRLGRFFTSDVDKGQKRHQAIYDRTVMGAARTLAAGLQSGVTSPARPWFRLALSDRDLMEVGAVKTWLFDCENLLRDIFTHSNTYRALHTMYGELGLFGTACAIVVEDFDNVIHMFTLTAGEYMIAQDSKGRVNTMAREFKYTVAQVVDEFGYENCSVAVRNLYDAGSYDLWVDIIHIIEPNDLYDPKRKDSKFMRYSSCYLEAGAPEDKFLRESGFKRFRVLAPRWEVTSGDIYGHGPGMEAQGDTKQLQHEQLRKSQAIDYMVNPPLSVPPGYKDNPRARLPGGVMFNPSATGKIESAYNVNLELQPLLEDIQDIRARVREAYYADLFMMLANDTRSGITATEVAERHEEKMLMIGPVLERLHYELLQPLIDITFDMAAEAGILPPIPEELQNMELSVEFISTLAQAQRIVSAQGMDRLFGTIATLAQLDPDIVLKANFAQAVDDYAALYSTNPEVIYSDDEYAARVDQRNQARAQQAQAAQQAQMAVNAKNLAAVPPDVLQGLQGYSTAGVV